MKSTEFFCPDCQKVVDMGSERHVREADQMGQCPDCYWEQQEFSERDMQDKMMGGR